MRDWCAGCHAGGCFEVPRAEGEVARGGIGGGGIRRVEDCGCDWGGVADEGKEGTGGGDGGSGTSGSGEFPAF